MENGTTTMGSLMMKKHDDQQSNQYAIRKGTAHRLMDVALLMANISQLKMVLDSGTDGHKYFYLLLVLIVLSLTCQVLFAVLVVISWSSKEADDSEAEVEYGVAGLKAEIEKHAEDEKELEEEKVERADETATEDVIVDVGESRDNEPLHKPLENERDEKSDKGKKDDKEKRFTDELDEIAAEKNNKKALERLEALMKLIQYKNRPKRRFTISLRTAEFLDRMTIFLVFLIIIINMFITGFGLQAPPSTASDAASVVTTTLKSTN